LESTRVKASHKHVGEIDPRGLFFPVGHFDTVFAFTGIETVKKQRLEKNNVPLFFIFFS